MIEPGLRGRVALITGANNPDGIGAAAARAIAAQGAAVFVHGLRPAGAIQPVPSGVDGDLEEPGEHRYRALQHRSADEIVGTIVAHGGRASSCERDLGGEDAAARLLDEVEAAFGTVSVLVNNAAYCEADTLVPTTAVGRDARAVDGFPMGPLTAGSFDRHISVNARAPALLIKEFAARLVARGERWGRVINISTDGARGFATEVSYGASKYALESLSRAAAVELGPFGITVNTVSPGPIQTGWISPALASAVAERTPLRRVGLPADVADVILFLASEQARWVTGQVLHVGGGHLL